MHLPIRKEPRSTCFENGCNLKVFVGMRTALCMQSNVKETRKWVCMIHDIVVACNNQNNSKMIGFQSLSPLGCPLALVAQFADNVALINVAFRYILVINDLTVHVGKELLLLLQEGFELFGIEFSANSSCFTE